MPDTSRAVEFALTTPSSHVLPGNSHRMGLGSPRAKPGRIGRRRATRSSSTLTGARGRHNDDGYSCSLRRTRGPTVVFFRPIALVILFAITLLSGMPSAEEGLRSLPHVTRFGGSMYDSISDIATDRVGNLYVTGTTRSADLPLKNPLQNAIGGDEGTSSAFVAKMSPTGELIFSTYFGGSDNDFGYDIEVDDSGAVYVTGSTRSDNLATTASVVQPRAACPNEFRWCADSFLLKLSSRGELLFATYLGFGNSEGVPRLAVTDGAIYLAGTARARLDQGQRGARLRCRRVSRFRGEIKSRCVGVTRYVTHIESNGAGFVAALTVDAERHVYVAGGGQSGCAFKSTPGVFSTPHGCLFVAKLAGENGSVDWLSRFGVLIPAK